MTSGMSSTSGNHHGNGGSEHKATSGQRVTRWACGQRVTRWVRGRWASGRLLARRALRRVGPAVALCVMLLSGLLGQLAAAGIGAAPVAYAAGQRGQPEVPNTLARFRATGNAGNSAPKPQPLGTWRVPHGPGGLTPDQAPSSVGKPAAQAIVIPLDAGFVAPQHGVGVRSGALSTLEWFHSQEGLIDLGLAPQSVDLRQATVAGARVMGVAQPLAGSYSLVFAQTAGGFRGTSKQLAQFSLQVVDAQGRALSDVQLLAPIELRAHYAPGELDGVNTQPGGVVLAWPQTADESRGIGAQVLPVAVDAKNDVLSASVPQLFGGTLVLSGTNWDANQASTEHLAMNDNQGDVSLSVPLAVPPAADGLTPPLELDYSSAGPNGRHPATTPATWVGDGWNLSFGSVTYDSTTNFYYLNGIGGVSEVLLCCMTDPQRAYVLRAAPRSQYTGLRR